MIGLYVQVAITPVRHVDSIREFDPALIDRLATLDGNLVLFEISPHRSMDSDRHVHSTRTPFNVHFEALLPGVAQQRFYSQMWDGWVWSVWRGEVVGAGTFRGRPLAETPMGESTPDIPAAEPEQEEPEPAEFEAAAPEPAEPEAAETDASIDADAVDPTHQGPGDSEGHAPYAPDEAEQPEDQQ